MKTVQEVEANDYLGGEDVVQEILESFAKHFPKKRLLALRLDGAEHTVFYDDAPIGESAHRVDVSFHKTEEDDVAHAELLYGTPADVQKAGRAFLKENGYGGHVYYAAHPILITFVDPEDR